MAIRRSSRRIARRGPSRRYAWARFSGGGAIAAGTIDSADTPLGDFETDLGGDLVGWRIERVLMTGLVTLDASAAANLDNAGYICALYVDETALTTSLANAGSDPRQFMYYRAGGLVTFGGGLDAQQSSGASVDRWEADIKAKRVFRRPDEQLRLFMQNTAPVTFSQFWSINLSILLSHAR